MKKWIGNCEMRKNEKVNIYCAFLKNIEKMRKFCQKVKKILSKINSLK